MLSRVFHAQDQQPVKNDWSVQVKKDLEQIGLGEMSFQEIKSKSKETFKKMVKDRCSQLAFSELMKEANTKSKMQNLKYDKLEMQKYLKSECLTTPQKKLLFKIRTRAVDTPDSYGRNEKCKMCNVERDEISHVIECVVVKIACLDEWQSDVKISDAYGDDVVKQRKLAVQFQKMWRIRKRILTNSK